MSETLPQKISAFEKKLSRDLGLTKEMTKAIKAWDGIEIKDLKDSDGYMKARMAEVEIKKKLKAVDQRRKDIKRIYVQMIDGTATAISDYITPSLIRMSRIINEHEEDNRVAAEESIKATNSRIEARLTQANAIGWKLDFQDARTWSDEKFESELIIAQENYMITSATHAANANIPPIEPITMPAIERHGNLLGHDVEALVKYADRLMKAEGPKDLQGEEARLIWAQAKLIIDQAARFIHDSIVS